MSEARSVRIYTRLKPSVGKRFDIRCAELGLKRPDGVEAAVEAWIAEGGPVAVTTGQSEPKSEVRQPHDEAHELLDKVLASTDAQDTRRIIGILRSFL